MLLVVDGLGHGLGAATAAREAIRIFRSNSQHSPARIAESAHAALRSTRGAVMGIAEIDLSQKLVRYAGVGNISGAIVSDGSSRHLVSTNGTVGQDVRKVQEFLVPVSHGCGPRASLGRLDLSLESEQLPWVASQGARAHCRHSVPRLPARHRRCHGRSRQSDLSETVERVGCPC